MENSRMKIYIAGPYTNGNKETNVKIAIMYAETIALKGHYPFIPHLTHYWDELYKHDYEFWMKQDLEWLLECDAMIRIPGDSPGADHEIEIAKENGIKIYDLLASIPKVK